MAIKDSAMRCQFDPDNVSLFAQEIFLFKSKGDSKWTLFEARRRNNPENHVAGGIYH